MGWRGGARGQQGARQEGSAHKAETNSEGQRQGSFGYTTYLFIFRLKWINFVSQYLKWTKVLEN